MNEIYVSTPVEGKPSVFENELQKNIYNLLEKLNIDYLRVENEPAVTMEDCLAIDRAFGHKSVKTLLLANRQKTNFYLLVMPAHKPFVTRAFSKALDISRVSFTDSETLEKMLGTPRGAATPFSIISDRDLKIRMIIDRDVCNEDKLITTDGTLHGYICLSTANLINKYIPASGHTAEIVDLDI